MRMILCAAVAALCLLPDSAGAFGRWGLGNGPVRQFFRGGPGGCDSCQPGQSAADGCASCSQPAAAVAGCACGPNCPCAGQPIGTAATAPTVAPLDYAALYALVARGGFGEVYVGTGPTALPVAPYSVVPAGYGGLTAGAYDVRPGAGGKPCVWPRASQPAAVRYVWQCGPNGCQRVQVSP